MGTTARTVGAMGTTARTVGDLLPIPAPGAALEWDGLLEAARAWGYPAEALRACPQEPVHHGEGDVLAHTRLVCDALVADAAWMSLPPQRRGELLLTGLLHDVAKPACTLVEDGRIRQPGHAHRGENQARVLLWRAGLGHEARERIAQAVRWHLYPFHLLERDDPVRLVTEIAESVSPRELAILARADARGRICADLSQLLDAVDLFAELAEEAGCGDGPYPFGSDAARFEYFRRPARDRSYVPFEPAERAHLVVLVGMPAVGKDTWCASHAGPVISLDAIRAELHVRPGDAQGRVVHLAKERLRSHLARHETVIWNATSLSRKIRTPLVGLAADYGATLEMVCLEAPEADLRARNGARPSPVPDAALSRMLTQWETPTSAECHHLVHRSTA